MASHIQSLRVLHLVGKVGGVHLAVWVGANIRPFFHTQHILIHVKFLTIGVEWVWLLVGGVRLVRAGGGVPLGCRQTTY